MRLKSIFACAVVCLLGAVSAIAQTQPNAAPFPFIKPQFLSSAGAPLAGGKLYFYVAGSSTPQDTYTTSCSGVDLSACTKNTNPVVLDSGGRASVFLGPVCYKVIAQNAGSVQQWTVDNVCDLALLFRLNFATQIFDKVCHAAAMTGTSPSDASGKIQACNDLMPATGGTIDARGIEGAQPMSATLHLTKPVTLLIGATAYSSSSGSGIATVSSPGVTIQCLNPNVSSFASTVDASGFTLSTAASNFTMSDCTVSGRDVHAAGIIGINAGGPTDVTLINDRITLWGGHCINTGGAGTAARWTLINVEADHCHEDGVLFTGTAPGTVDSTIIGGSYHHNGANGIDINGSRNRVIGPSVYNNGCPGGPVDVFGILIAGVSGLADANENAVVAPDVYSNCGPGVIVRAEAGKTANDNQIIGGHSNSNSGTSGNGDGVTIDGSSAGSMLRNKIFGTTANSNQRSGFQIDGSVGTVQLTTVDGVTAISNTVYGIVDSATDTQLRDYTALSNGTNVLEGGTRPTDAGGKVTLADGFYRINQAVGIAGPFIQVGTSPANAGVIRIPINSPLEALGSDGMTARQLIQLNPSDITIVGEAGFAAAFPGGVYLGTATGGNEGNGTINTQGYYLNGTAGAGGTISVRKGDNSGACNLVFSGGLLISTTC